MQSVASKRLRPLPRGSEAPRYHYSGPVLLVKFLADANKVRNLLPKGISLHIENEKAVCFASTRDLVAFSEHEPHAVVEDPQRTQYKEALIAVAVKSGKEIGIHVPIMWTKSVSSKDRGMHYGFPKTEAKVSMTRWDENNPGLGRLRKGVRLAGKVATRSGDKIFDIDVTLHKQLGLVELTRITPAGPYFQERVFPAADVLGSAPAVRELVKIVQENSRRANAWLGRGRISFARPRRASLPEFGRVRVVGAAYYHAGWTNPVKMHQVSKREGRVRKNVGR